MESTTRREWLKLKKKWLFVDTSQEGSADMDSLVKPRRMGVDVCPYRHPKVCHKWMQNGNNKVSPLGCIKGDDCEFYHPQICKQSLKNRTCGTTSPDGKCSKGYHLKGTKKIDFQKIKKKKDREKEAKKDDVDI